eukprot:3106026-Prymnesium_polylepis.1
MPLPRRKTSALESTTPRQETIESGAPMAESIAAASASSRSIHFQSTLCVHSSPDAHFGTRPDLERLVTCAPVPTSILHTRDPTKPDPPTTVALSAPDGVRSQRNRIAWIRVVAIICGHRTASWRAPALTKPDKFFYYFLFETVSPYPPRCEGRAVVESGDVCRAELASGHGW